MQERAACQPLQWRESGLCWRTPTRRGRLARSGSGHDGRAPGHGQPLPCTRAHDQRQCASASTERMCDVSWERHAPAWLREPGWSPALPGGSTWHNSSVKALGEQRQQVLAGEASRLIRPGQGGVSEVALVFLQGQDAGFYRVFGD